MEHKDITTEVIETELKSFFEDLPRTGFLIKERNIRVHTGIGGADLFDTAMDRQVGFERVMLGKKLSRITRLVKGREIFKNKIDVYYYKIKIKTSEDKHSY